MAKPFDFRSELDALLQRQRYRRRRILSSAQGVNALVGGKSVRVFCSNDYLGLASHPKVTKAFQDAAGRFGVGSGASHLVVGHHALHHELEEALAARVGAPRALLFSSGYAANLGVIAALVGRRDVLLQDKWNHASLLDGGQLCGAKFHRYGHLDLDGLQRRLDAVDEQQHCLVATDSVFSMDGDIAPLPRISALCASRNAWLMVDDAHGFGVLGEGRGTPQALGCAEGVPVYMATLGKAIGVGGAFVAGNDSLIEYLIQRARTYIYTTALPPAMAAACLASLRLLDEEAWRRDHLRMLIERFQRGAQHLGLRVGASQTAIQPLMLGADAAAVEASEWLWEEGFFVSAIRPPTVPEGSARLRITLSADHSEQDVDDLLCALAALPLESGEPHGNE
ncbi:Aminotransferase class-I [gamma proteobacterium HdN1]|nr:Aminotransferase class-I [gamma proteobacterium HdN1]